MSATGQSRRSIPSREEGHRLWDELCDLRERTDPETCTNPESVVFRGETIGKDRAADEAVQIACRLFGAAMWAVHHRAARSIIHSEVPVDSHDYERRGSEMLSSFGAFSAEDSPWARKVLANFLEPFCHLDMMGFLYAVRDSLAALDFGEVMPLFCAATASRKGRYSAMKMRLEAVEIVHYLHSEGLSLKAARERVGAAFGADDKTVRSWETRDLPDMLPEGQLAKEIAKAKLAGETSRLFRNKPETVADASHASGLTGASIFRWKVANLDALGKAWREWQAE